MVGGGLLGAAGGGVGGTYPPEPVPIANAGFAETNINAVMKREKKYRITRVLYPAPKTTQQKRRRSVPFVNPSQTYTEESLLQPKPPHASRNSAQTAQYAAPTQARAKHSRSC